MSSVIAQAADIEVRAPNGELRLVVEVKKKNHSSIEWAIAYRRNLYQDALLPSSPYFLLTLADYFYLWKDADRAALTLAPDYIEPAAPLLSEYLGAKKLEDVSSVGFEIIVESWLASIINSSFESVKAEARYRWLVDSGLHQAIAQGVLQFESLA